MRLRYNSILFAIALTLVFIRPSMAQNTIELPASSTMSPVLASPTISIPEIVTGTPFNFTPQELSPPIPFLLPQNEKLDLFYYQQSAQNLDLIAGFNYGSFVTLALGERFTLPTDSGHVDTVMVLLDSALGTGFAVTFWPDMIGTGPQSQEVHLPGTPSIAAYHVNQYAPHAMTKIIVPHVAVPKEFYILIFADVSGNTITGQAIMRSDIGPSKAPSLDSRSMMIINVNGNTIAYPADSVFSAVTGEPPVSTNFYMHAIVDTTQSPTASVTLNKSSFNFSASQNPFSTITELNLTGLSASDMASARVSLFDALGRELMSVAPRTTSVKISGASLPVGQYTAVLQTASGRSVLPLRVVR
jgi:hypothetical protein